MKYNFTPAPVACCTFLLLTLTPAVVRAQPANDACAAASVLSSSITCINTAGNLKNALATAGIPGSCGPATAADVWYRFTAQTAYPTITLSAVGTDFSAAGPRIQILSGLCGGFSSVACQAGTLLNTALSPGGAGLTPGITYYVRITSGVTGTSGSLWGFNICITDRPASRIEARKSYINISKSTGGTIDPGDTLEIRSTLVVSSNSADSLAFIDTLYNGKGFRLVPGSIALRTNEGKIYKPFTDAFDGDAGWRYTSGLDTIIRINIGAGATNAARGKLFNTSKPSFYNSSCIVMATYRVVVYKGYGTKINFRGGLVTYRDVNTGVLTNNNFTSDSVIVYQSPGLCPNAVSATNAIGIEGNGTFGRPAVTPPLLRNRGTSAYTNYTYNPFSPAGGPQDYYYTIANNTSTTYTTVNTWFKPSSYRLFTLWDIIGDHTGAANPARGNQPCDTTKPVSATNPCGYMLVINSAYRTDTAFQYTINNLCPNTYYELSSWIRNICYRCGCDSNGVGSSGGAYIPSGLNDSSGVQPNIAFDVNGVDYYTTGNIPYSGVTPSGSDSTNKWVKKGFTYLTGPAETSFTLTIRNNAPGGGGNDWAIDDISVVTCLPNMRYSPSSNPTLCMGNTITIFDTVRSYYNTYRNYKWQRSTNGGTTWVDIAGTTGVATPVWNGSAWQYVTSYGIPTAWTTLANNGDKYRVVVATTAANLTNVNCIFTDGIAIITLNVIDCGSFLDVRMLSFSGKKTADVATLHWSTTPETEAVTFEVERSTDGVSFYRIATVAGAGNSTANSLYSYTDSGRLGGTLYYRIAMVSALGRRAQSHIIQLQSAATPFVLSNVVNPFSDALLYDVTLADGGTVQTTLLDASGHCVRRQSTTASAGVNNMVLPDVATLSSGVYIVQVRYKDQTQVRRVVKK